MQARARATRSLSICSIRSVSRCDVYILCVDSELSACLGIEIGLLWSIDSPWRPPCLESTPDATPGSRALLRRLPVTGAGRHRNQAGCTRGCAWHAERRSTWRSPPARVLLRFSTSALSLLFSFTHSPPSCPTETSAGASSPHCAPLTWTASATTTPSSDASLATACASSGARARADDTQPAAARCRLRRPAVGPGPG